MIQFSNLSVTDYIVFGALLPGILIYLAIRLNKKKNRRRLVDEHAIHLGGEATPAMAYGEVPLAK